MSKPTERFTIVMVIFSVFGFAGCDDPEPRVRYTHEYAFKSVLFVGDGSDVPIYVTYQGILPKRPAPPGDPECIDIEAGTKVLLLKFRHDANYVQVQSGPHTGVRGWVHDVCLVRPSD